MKWKFILILLAVCTTSLLCTVYYYGFDPSVLASLSFYENLANPTVRIIRVKEGLRKEEIAEVIGNKLGWNDAEKSEFMNSHLALSQTSSEGYFFPKTYMIQKDENPRAVSSTMFKEFTKETAGVKKPKTTQIINQDTAVKIASIIQREAAGKSDMKLISGIIWNRLFGGMKLQMDSTLQYATGSEADGWWEQVSPADKYIKSSYNTYLHIGLPPTPIANPGLAAIEAAYNPQKTSCLFFLHDKRGDIHCAKTYEEHKKNIDRYY